jgi:hypothetical protein
MAKVRRGHTDNKTPNTRRTLPFGNTTPFDRHLPLTDPIRVRLIDTRSPYTLPVIYFGQDSSPAALYLVFIGTIITFHG